MRVALFKEFTVCNRMNGFKHAFNLADYRTQGALVVTKAGVELLVCGNTSKSDVTHEVE